MILNYAMGMDPQQFKKLDPMLQSVVLAAASFAYGKYGKGLLITSMIRDSGIHATGRGCDVDVCDGTVYEGGLLPIEAEVLCSHINGRFKYDILRPEKYVAFYGHRDKSAKHNNHIHFQTCHSSRTEMIG